jgi:hypothetical protein
MVLLVLLLLLHGEHHSCADSSLLSKSLCQATSLLLHSDNSSFIQRNNYPDLMLNLASPKLHDPWNCTLDSFKRSPQICISPQIKSQPSCPVSREQVEAALSAQSWPSRDQSFCQLKSEILRNAARNGVTDPGTPINVAFLGGSMPHGSDLNGYCCCFQHIDSRCPAADLSSPLGTPQNICSVGEFCSWVTLFVQWLRLEFPVIRFRFHIQTIGGIGSGMVPSILGKFLRSVNFTANDFIFLDYSVNDAARMPTSCPGPDSVTHEVELMLRHLFHSIRCFPTVILLEQYPHSSIFGYGAWRPFPYEQRIHETCDYGAIYRKLASHYNLILWSAREAYWTNHNFNISEEKRYPLSVYETVHKGNHPPWYIHWYLVDLYSSLFRHQLHQCPLEHHSHEGTTAPNSLPPRYLNESLYAHEKFCLFGKKMLVEYRPWRKDVPGTLTGPDAVASGWREYADHREIPGYIITNYSNPLKWTLSFPFETDLEVGSSTVPQLSYVGMILVTRYLKSYENMGRVEIGICGRRTGVILDGLDTEHHVSIPHQRIYDISARDSEECLRLPVSERSVDYFYLGPTPQEQLLRHKLTSADSAIRGVHKFKLLAVEFCERDRSSVFRKSRRGRIRT